MTNTIATPATVKVSPKTIEKVKAILRPRTIRAVIAFSNAKRAIKKAEERKARAEAIIRADLLEHGAEIGMTPDGIKLVEVMHSSNSKNDKDVLKARFPDAYAASLVTTQYDYLKII